MSIPSHSHDRLAEIERILAQTTFAGASNDSSHDPAAVHLADVPTARIRELTRMLQHRPIEARDAIDAVAMRLLLNDYNVALTHLRAVAVVAASLVDGAAVPVKQTQRFLRLDDRRREKREVHTATSSGPGTGS